MLFGKKVDRTLDLLKEQKGEDNLPLLQEEQEEGLFEKGDALALILGAFRAFWPIFLVLLLLLVLLEVL